MYDNHCVYLWCSSWWNSGRESCCHGYVNKLGISGVDSWGQWHSSLCCSVLEYAVNCELNLVRVLDTCFWTSCICDMLFSKIGLFPVYMYVSSGYSCSYILFLYKTVYHYGKSTCGLRFLDLVSFSSSFLTFFGIFHYIKDIRISCLRWISWLCRSQFTFI